MLLAYFTPEVVLPLTSVVAAVFGFAVMVGRAPFRLLARAARAVGRGCRAIFARPGS